MPCDRLELTGPGCLNKKQFKIFLDLIRLRLFPALAPGTDRVWDCPAKIADAIVKEGNHHALMAGAIAHLGNDRVREVQVRFDEMVYAFLDVAPPRLELDQLGDNPLEIRCSKCDEMHKIPIHRNW